MKHGKSTGPSLYGLQLGLWVLRFLFVALIAFTLGSCQWPVTAEPPIPTAEPVEPYMKMNPPPDSDKPLPVPADDLSCWLHTAANMLAGAGYGNGTSVQDRADDIWNDMDATFRNTDGSFDGGWIDGALQWWLGSTNNTWTNNPYTLVTVYGNKVRIPWANANGAQDLANELRSCNLVGVSISWPDGGGAGGYGGHAITGWGDTELSSQALTANPAGIIVTDSDTDNGGDVQSYTYDAYNNPNPGGFNEGNGWYFDYDANQPFIKHITTLSPTTNASGGVNTVRVIGSLRIQQIDEEDAIDLHYDVGTDVNILTYRTWLDWPGEPTITESQPRRQISVDWDLSEQEVPQGTWVTISTEFIEPAYNGITYRNVHFTYPKEPRLQYDLPMLAWIMETPIIDKAEAIPNFTGGYVIGSFDLYDPDIPDEPAFQYLFMHQYLYNQDPEYHTLSLYGTEGYMVTNLQFGHVYGYLPIEDLWRFKDWMKVDRETYTLIGEEEAITIKIDWEGLLPYPEGDESVD